MTWPTNFGSLAGGNEPLSLFDTMFNQVAAMIAIPSAASGATAISLTPLVNCPILTSYSELCGFRFRPAGPSTGPVTVQFNGLGFLPAYHADGLTQVSTNDINTGLGECVARYSAALNSGAGGFFIEVPTLSLTTGVGGVPAAPGGRLTLQSGIPVMSSTTASTTVWYAPYSSAFVPIFNGTTIQMYQFTSSQGDKVGLALAMGGSGTFPGGTSWDVFATLVAGIPTLVVFSWASNTTRNIGLSVYGGFLTNATGNTGLGTAGPITVAPNQGTFLGSFRTTSAGTTQYQFAGTASGGFSASFLVSNYYNQVLVNSICTDTQAPYTYTAATARPSGPGASNVFTYLQASSERAANFVYNFSCQPVGVAGAICFCGLGVTAGPSFNSFSSISQDAASVYTKSATNTFSLASTGLTQIFALEEGDGTHANTFNAFSDNQLIGQIWL